MNSEDMNNFSELAELIGILLGDGSINVYSSSKYSTFYRVKISCHSAEKEYIDYLTHLVEKVLEIRPRKSIRKNEQTTEILLFHKHIVEKLLDIGMKPSPKWKRAIIPPQFLSQIFALDVLRGYFDTDGSVVLANNNGILYPRLEMKICPSPMQSQLLKILGDNDFHYKKYEIGKGEIRVQMNGKNELNKWIQKVGFHNPKHKRRADSVLGATPSLF